MTTPLTIWCNAWLSSEEEAAFRAQLHPHKLIFSGTVRSNLIQGASDPACRDADIAYGQPNPEDVVASSSLRWIHLSSAGYTRYDTDAIRKTLKSRNAIMTNSSSVFAEPCAQHLLAMMLGLSRQLPQAAVAQTTKRDWALRQIRHDSYLLLGQSALLVGFGAIARRLVELLAPFKMQLAGIRRMPTGAESIPVHPMSEIDALLPKFDHVIDILPSSPANKHFFKADRFAHMKAGATFYNVGRGDTVEQNALVSALREKQIRAAYLDVTSPEPLPSDHELWTTPNCFITPHTAGGHANESARQIAHFTENFSRFLDRQKMADQILR